jgi:hypothetical protein
MRPRQRGTPGFADRTARTIRLAPGVVVARTAADAGPGVAPQSIFASVRLPASDDAGVTAAPFTSATGWRRRRYSRKRANTTSAAGVPTDMQTPVLEALMRAEAEGAEDTARRAAGTQESETLTSLLSRQRLRKHHVNPSVVPAQQANRSTQRRRVLFETREDVRARQDGTCPRPTTLSGSARVPSRDASVAARRFRRCRSASCRR